MAIIVPPTTPYQVRTNHPSKPEQGDDEDYVAYLGRCADHWIGNPPPAPEGFELMECHSEPRHWPEYRVIDDDFYPGYCSGCQYNALRETASKWECRAMHRRWKSWHILGWLNGKAYVLGIIAGSGVAYGRCEHCGIGRQYMRPRWRGKRPYILGVYRETWICLRHGHRRRESIVSRGICTVCLPCPECGSTAPEHISCEAI